MDIKIHFSINIFYLYQALLIRVKYRQAQRVITMTDTIEKRKQVAITHVTKQVFPFTTNNQQTLFGGIAMQWMDEVGFITATRFCRQKMVTVSMDKIDFKVPIPSGSIVELLGEIEHVGNTSLGVLVTVTVEDMLAGGRQVAMTGKLTFVAVDDNTRPIPLSVHSSAGKAKK